MGYICPQCNRKVECLLQLLYSSGKVCQTCFELEVKEGLIEEIEWEKFQYASRLREIMEESFWEEDFVEEKAYLREQIKKCDKRIEKLNGGLDKFDV